MPLTRQQKEEVVQQVQQAASEATSIVFVGYNGLTLSQIEELRGKLYEAGCSMRVVPKRLLRLALQNAQLSFNPSEHEGQMALVWGTDAVAPAKTLHEFAKGKETIRLLAGALEGSVISLEQVQALAQLPSREQMIARLVGTIAGPLRGMVGVLSGVPRATVYVLQAIHDKKSQ